MHNVRAYLFIYLILYLVIESGSNVYSFIYTRLFSVENRVKLQTYEPGNVVNLMFDVVCSIADLENGR